MANLYDLKKFDLNLLVIFECIYQHLSISKAAESLYITPSAVSQSLQRLRAQFNDPLFIRSGKGIAPTTTGLNLHHHLEKNLKGLEQFVREFAEWFSQKRPAAMMIGIRADESYNRFVAIASLNKQRFADDKPWTTAAPGGHSWYIYPIYDWKVADIWTWYANHQSLCNPLYNLMYQAGVPLRHMRICEPFGPEQRQGLWLYHVIEPDRWAAMCARVSGVKSGGIYAGHDNHFYGHRKILKPEHLDWQEYALLLLNSMPEKTAEHYRNKIAIYLHWYQKKGIEVPQTQQGDIGAKDIPSWRRICKVLLNNDYWCRALSFSPTKAKNYQRYNERIKGKRQEWGILCNND
ncbi:DUF3440 domain-containing protein [Escherichia coli]